MAPPSARYRQEHDKSLQISISYHNLHSIRIFLIESYTALRCVYSNDLISATLTSVSVTVRPLPPFACLCPVTARVILGVGPSYPWVLLHVHLSVNAVMTHVLLVKAARSSDDECTSSDYATPHPDVSSQLGAADDCRD